MRRSYWAQARFAKRLVRLYSRMQVGFGASYYRSLRLENVELYLQHRRAR